MSNQIREYTPDNNWFEEAGIMNLTAVVGGENHGHSIQFTINSEYIVLTEAQCLDLISTIAMRLSSRRGFQATEFDTHKVVTPDGLVVEP